MTDYKVNKKTVSAVGDFKPKKITGTKFASILDLNEWSTPFKTWCDMTKVYVEPFVDSIYTIAGKEIEPIIIDYLKQKIDYGEVVDGETFWGKDFMKRRFDYFPEEEIFGGMWDALVLGKRTGKPTAVIEIKTTKRVQDWEDGIPPYYKLQAMLYAKLLGVKNVIFAVAFLNDGHYADPKSFIASDETVKIISFRLDDAEITTYMDMARDWYTNHILSKKSPNFQDNKVDNEILAILRTSTLNVDEDSDLDTLMAEFERLQALDDKHQEEVGKALKSVKSTLKEKMTESMGEDEDKSEIVGKGFKMTVSKSTKTVTVFDEKSFKEKHENLFNDFSKDEEKTTFTQRVSKLK